MDKPEWLNDKPDLEAFEYTIPKRSFPVFFKWVAGLTLIGLVLGTILALSQSLLEGNWDQAVWFIPCMIVMSYCWGLVLWVIFAIEEWTSK